MSEFKAIPILAKPFVGWAFSLYPAAGEGGGCFVTTPSTTVLRRGGPVRVDRAVTAGRAALEDLGRPVTMAQARAETIAGQVGSQVAALTLSLNQVVDELRTLGDPDAAAVQIDTVTTEADQRVAEAVARAARAEQNRRIAKQQRVEADPCR